MSSTVKLRSKRTLTKRFKILPKRGSLKHWHSHTSHLAYSKSTKQKRHLRKSCLLDISD